MISVVVPLFNEEESLKHFYKELRRSLPLLGKRYEIIFIDDGSTDDSLSILLELAKKDKTIRIFSFRKNRGKSEALSMGFEKAKGEHIVTLDADLQDQPTEIGKLYKKAKSGIDVVCGWRKQRKDAFFKRLSSKLFNITTNIFWKLKLHDYNCGLKVYTKDVAKSIKLYGGLHRFIPILAHQEGFVVEEVPIVHQKRKFGKTKFGFSKLWRELPDIFTMLFLTRYRNRPLHFFGVIGGLLFIVGIAILVYLSILHFMGQAIGRRPLIFFGMLLVISGIQTLFTGFLADLIIHVMPKNNHVVLLRFDSDKKK